MTFTDTMHSALAGVTVLIILLGMGFGAAAHGRRFRLYSIGTLLTLLVLGAVLRFMSGSQLATQGVVAPPRWFGLIERIDIYGFLLWIVVLAIVLLRERDVTGSIAGRDSQRGTGFNERVHEPP